MPAPLLYDFLVVGDLSDEYGMQILQEALDALGHVDITSKNDAMSHFKEKHYDAVIVDAGAVPDTAAFVSRIREVHPDTRVVVITATPHWRVARAVFRAGAADYFRKSQDSQGIRTKLRELLEPRPS